MPAKVRRVTLVFAHWCPHCDPLSLEAAQRMGRELGVPVKFLDIDIREQEKEANRIVREHGDWSEDYTIPQVFLEFTNGTVKHVFTGCREGLHATRRALANLFESRWYKELVEPNKT